MRATILALSALLGLSLCVMHEVSAEKPDSNQSSISTPITLYKRGSKGHKGKKGHGKKHRHGDEGGNEQSDVGDGSKKDGEIIDTVSKTLLNNIRDAVNPTLSGLKLPGGK